MRRSQTDPLDPLDPLAPLARAFAGAFETAKRDNGETFVRLTDGATEWVRDAVREAHDGEFPNDWRYAMCERIADDLADALEDGADMDDVTHEIADLLTDMDTSDLFQWLADNTSRAQYVDDANAEMGHADSLAAQVQAGQFRCIRSMAETLLSAIRDAAENAE